MGAHATGPANYITQQNDLNYSNRIAKGEAPPPRRAHRTQPTKNEELEDMGTSIEKDGVDHVREAHAAIQAARTVSQVLPERRKAIELRAD